VSKVPLGAGQFLLPDEEREGVLQRLPENLESECTLVLDEGRTRSSADGRTRFSTSPALVYGKVDEMPILEVEMEFDLEMLHRSREEKDALEAKEEVGVLRMR